MIKIKSIKFKDHKILGEKLELDFCDKDGNPVDTIIIAGENGTGKTTVLNEIEKILTYQYYKSVSYEIINDNIFKCIDEKFYKDDSEIKVEIDSGESIEENLVEFKNSSNFTAPLFAAVNINFSPNDKIKNVGASILDLDDEERKKFTENTAENLKQLFVDITNSDYKTKADKYDEIIQNGKIPDKNLPLKIDRFKNAFDDMIKNLKFKGIESKDGNIEILFEKNGKEISIDDLSSGEKQIVVRGAFLLRDKSALNGAVVLIDEPEISMHPKWQEKILDYYRNLFVDGDKKQTSQIIISTHSNFVIEKALELDNSIIIALQENNDKPKKIMKNDGTFILPSVTAAEINYNVFDIASIDYHIQLFGYLQSLMENKLSKKMGKKINMDIKKVDDKIKNNQSLLSKNVLQDSQGNACQWSYKKTTYDTICCFIRNAIDHPEYLSNQTKTEYTKADLRYSIEILIELINLVKQNKLNLS